MNAHHLSRKFLLASAIILVSSVALFTKNIGGGEWVAIATLALSSYGVADVTHQVLDKRAA